MYKRWESLVRLHKTQVHHHIIRLPAFFMITTEKDADNSIKAKKKSTNKYPQMLRRASRLK